MVLFCRRGRRRLPEPERHEEHEDRKSFVLTPPPVEPGEAPMNMSSMVTNCAALDNLAWGKVSKPAVLAVTD
jgi:hypothetical protein